jgi:hypothetical protein
LWDKQKDSLQCRPHQEQQKLHKTAFKLTGIHNINQICRGIRNHKKAGGYFWKYEKDFTEEELALMFPKSQ